MFLRSLEQKNSPAFLDLKEKGFGASITGDLVTELFNKEMKSAVGPFRRGFSTISTSVNIWVRTMHIQSRLLRSFKKVVAYKTKSMHKELTHGGKELHEKHANDLKVAVIEYGIDPFRKDPPNCFPTGEVIDADIVSDILSAPRKGNDSYKSFVTELLPSNKEIKSKVRNEEEETTTKREVDIKRRSPCSRGNYFKIYQFGDCIHTSNYVSTSCDCRTRLYSSIVSKISTKELFD